MLTVAIVLLSIFVSSAHAGQLSTKCSNSDGTVVWETGDDENLVHLKYSNFIEGTLTLDLSQVNLSFSSEVVIKEKSFRYCDYLAHKKVYAGKVTIIPSDKHPDVLRSLFPLNRIQTEVICTLFAKIPRTCHAQDNT